MDITGSVSYVAKATGAAQTGNAAEASQKQAEEIRESQPQEQVKEVEEAETKSSDGNTVDVYA